MTTTPRGDLGSAEASLSPARSDGAVITAPDVLAAYEADRYWPAPAAKAAGEPSARPDAVVRPRTEEEVATAAREHHVPVVGIVLDLCALDQVIAIDEVSRQALTAETGAAV